LPTHKLNASLRNQVHELTGLSAPPKASRTKFDLSPLRQFFAKGELDQETAQTVAAMIARGTKEIFSFCFGKENLDERGLRIAMRRFVSIAWLLHSEMLIGENDEPLTLEQLGNLPLLNCTKVTLSLNAQDFGRKFKFQGRTQKRQHTKPNYASAAVGGWAKRRAREKAEAARA
jgi:hypothetical protein